ncbi:MAG: MerR family DNA-binding protein [Alphaproteobacteria bacterium]|nr:MerR family DNA-binding protein [Alphaproteobacteria bacterium]
MTDARGDASPIGEASRRTGVHIETIRYYEKIGLLPPPPRTSGGRRAYGAAQMRRLAFIRRARELGFSLKEIRALLGLGDRGVATCADVCAITERHLESIRAKIADLQKLESFLMRNMRDCSGEAVPECAILDALDPSSADSIPKHS